jgi:ABC-type transport system involved in cytochrome bd biosynthesis fused ATPase/permease subunit
VIRDLGRLLALTVPERWRMGLAVLLGFATVAAGIGLMSTSAYLISMAALGPSIADLHVAIAGVRFFGISRGVFRYLERIVSHQVTFELLTRIRGLGGALTTIAADGAVFASLWIAVPLVRRGELEGIYLAVVALTVLAAFEAVVPLPSAYQLDADRRILPKDVRHSTRSRRRGVGAFVDQKALAADGWRAANVGPAKELFE